MGNIISLSEHQPHIVIETKNGVHVLPISLIQKVANGQIDITEIDQYEEICQTVFGVFLENLPLFR